MERRNEVDSSTKAGNIIPPVPLLFFSSARLAVSQHYSIASGNLLSSGQNPEWSVATKLIAVQKLVT
jgi:hypothetical protein